MLAAQRQKEAATRLQGYLMYWQGLVLDNDLFRVFYQGVKWNEEIIEILGKGGSAEELVNLKDEKKKLIDEIKVKLENAAEIASQEDFIREIAKLPEEIVGSFLDYRKTTRQNLIEGKTFISDGEATCLGLLVMHQSIELKMNLIALMDTAVMILLSAVNKPEEFEVKKFANEIAQAAWKGVIVSKNIDSLMKTAKGINSKSLVELTIRNMHKEL